MAIHSERAFLRNYCNRLVKKCPVMTSLELKYHCLHNQTMSVVSASLLLFECFIYSKMMQNFRIVFLPILAPYHLSQYFRSHKCFWKTTLVLILYRYLFSSFLLTPLYYNVVFSTKQVVRPGRHKIFLLFFTYTHTKS